MKTSITKFLLKGHVRLGNDKEYRVNDRKLKICFVLPAHWGAVMGGSQYQAKLLLEYLLERKEYDIHYLARRVPGPPSPEGYMLNKVADPTGIRRYGEVMDTFDLLKLLKRISPDVIYQRVGCAYTGITAYYAKKNKRRCVWHVAHDREVMPFDWRLTPNIAFRYFDKRFLEYGLRNAGAVITQTQQQADYMWRYYKRKEDAIIPNFHPLPAEELKKNNVVTIVWVANLKPWKRPELFIRLARDLKELSNIEFIMIGKPLGDSEWCNEIKKQADQRGNMRFLGGQSQDVVNETLSKAHIFVNTSEQEGFANTFIQSWLRKVPVVSLSVNPDGVFDQHEIGFYAKTYGNLKECVARLIKDESLRESMGERARKYAVERYSQDNLQRIEQVLIRS